MIILEKIQQYEMITDTIVNKLFEKLEDLRQKFQNNPSGHNAFNTSVAYDNNIIDLTYPQQIKNNLQELSNTSYKKKKSNGQQYQLIKQEHVNQIAIPAVNDLIKATDAYNNYVDILNDLYNNICDDYSDYNVCSCNGHSCGCDGMDYGTTPSYNFHGM